MFFLSRMDYFDTASVECSSLNKEELRRSVHEPAAFSCKTFHWEGVMLYSDEFSSNSRILSKSVCSSGSSPESKDARVTIILY